MRRLSCALAALSILTVAVAGCSKGDQTSAKSDVQDAAHSTKAAFDKAVSDAHLKSAEADLKKFGHEAGQDLRKAGADAKASVHHLASDTHHTADKHSDRDKSDS